jgi:cytochrome c-L
MSGGRCRFRNSNGLEFGSMPLNLLSLPRMSLLGLTIVSGGFGVSPAAAGDLSDFKSPLDNSPMTFPLQAGEVETPAVKNFKATGVNEYRGDADAIAEGKKLYTANCIVCHGADGTGKMGPTLVGKDVVYPQALTDPGMFSIVYGGASGAMQSFARRGMQQEQMLKIIAYVRSLDK